MKRTAKNYGEVSLAVETDLDTDIDSVFLGANVIFDFLEPVPVERPDTSFFEKGRSGREYWPKRIVLPLPISGVKLGYNYPFAFEDLSASSSFRDNFVYEVFWQPFHIKKVSVMLEFGVSNLGLMDGDGTRYRMCALEGTLSGRFKIFDRTSLAIGGGAMHRLSVFVNDNETPVSNNDFDRWFFHAFLDVNVYLGQINLGFFNPKFEAGIRGSTYFHPTFAGREKNLAPGLQGYLRIWF